MWAVLRMQRKLGQGTFPERRAVPGEGLGSEPSAATQPDSGGKNVSVFQDISRWPTPHSLRKTAVILEDPCWPGLVSAGSPGRSPGTTRLSFPGCSVLTIPGFPPQRPHESIERDSALQTPHAQEILPQALSFRNTFATILIPFDAN